MPESPGEEKRGEGPDPMALGLKGRDLFFAFCLLPFLWLCGVFLGVVFEGLGGGFGLVGVLGGSFAGWIVRGGDGVERRKEVEADGGLGGVRWVRGGGGDWEMG